MPIPPGEDIILLVTVRDTGIGIPGEKIERLFDPFYQVDSSATREYAGTGLGLAICKQLIRLLGGDIGVESWPGRGSVFFFSILAKIPVDSQGESSLPGGFEGIQSLAGSAVLFADPHPLDRQQFRALAERWRIDATLAGTSRSCLSLINGNRDQYDAVVVDSEMVMTDGSALASWLIRQDLPQVIVYEPLGATGERRRETSCLGASAILHKPINASALASALCRAFKPRAAHNPNSILRGGAENARDGQDDLYRRRVIIADSQVSSLQRTLGELRQARLPAHGCHDLDELLQACQSREPLVLVVDTELLEREPASVTHNLIQSARRSSYTPLIAVTPFITDNQSRALIAQGFDGVIRKPVQLRDLRDVLREVRQLAQGD